MPGQVAWKIPLPGLLTLSVPVPADIAAEGHHLLNLMKYGCKTGDVLAGGYALHIHGLPDWS